MLAVLAGFIGEGKQWPTRRCHGHDSTVIQTGRVRQSDPPGESRRVKKRYVALVIVVALVMGSERWDGPFTFESLQRAGAEATGATPDDELSEREVGEVYLTFDDGPHLTWTPAVLDVLAQHRSTATFFPIGNQVDGGAELLRRAVEDGHKIGNHTWDHDRLVGIAPTAFDLSVGRTRDAIRRATGVAPTCLRPPQGVIDDATRELAVSAGLSVELWTIDPQDWTEPGAGAIVDDVIGQVDAGAVILLHDGGGDRGQTVRAVDELLDRLGRAGFSFRALPGC